jgi:hypothetical protein
MKAHLRRHLLLALVALAVVPGDDLRGEDRSKPLDSPRPAEGRSAQQFLQSRTDVVAQDEPLGKLLRRVAAGQRMRIWFDERAITSAGLRLDEPVTVVLRNFTVKKALERILRGRVLHHSLDGDVLVISTVPPRETVELRSRQRLITFDQATEENGVVKRQVADTTLDLWLFGNSRDPSETRARFAQILARKADAIAERCSLSENQKQKLNLAGRGDISRFFERLDRLRSQFSEVKSDDQRRNDFFEQQVMPLEAVLNAGPFDGNSLFSKTVAASLTAEQAARRSPDALAGYDLLATIGLALQGYHDYFGAFPASVIQGPDGKTTYSWRVELLPMLKYYVDDQPGGEKLWRGQMKPDELRNEYWKLIEGLGYRLGEPWDSPHNRAVEQTFSPYYRHPGDPAKSVNSAFFVVTGAETAFPPGRRTSLDDARGGPGSTLLVVETRRDIPWTKPEDIPFDPRQPLPSFGSYEKDVFFALTCDGAVHPVPATTPESDLRALITRHARDAVSIPGIPWKAALDRSANVDDGGTGALSVLILFDGPPPAPRMLNAPGAVAPVPDESLLVDAKTGGIANVVVYLDKVPAGVIVPAEPPPPVAMAIVGSRFAPRVLAVRTGQDIVVSNNDPGPENVHPTPLRNAGSNRVLNSKGMYFLSYSKPESVPIAIKSDLHPWMKAYHVVGDHPWAAVSNAQGALVVKGLPPGAYQFKVWHEGVGYLERKLEVQIKAGETTEARLAYPAERFAR